MLNFFNFFNIFYLLFKDILVLFSNDLWFFLFKNFYKYLLPIYIHFYLYINPFIKIKDNKYLDLKLLLLNFYLYFNHNIKLTAVYYRLQ